MSDELFPRVIEEYEDGSIVVQEEDGVYARMTNKEEIVFGDDPWSPHPWRARLYLALRQKLGAFNLLDSYDVVPVVIAVDGKPAIASYLFAAHGVPDDWNENRSMDFMAREAIANILDVSWNTVTKYWGRITTRVEEKRLKEKPALEYYEAKKISYSVPRRNGRGFHYRY